MKKADLKYFRKTYNKVIGDKNYPVIFGTFDEDGHILSHKGRRNDTHDDYGMDGGDMGWRFVPITGVCYWWDRTGAKLHKMVDAHLQEHHKIEGKIIHRIIGMDFGIRSRITRMTCHWRDYENDAYDNSALPTFNQWLKFHYSGD